MIKLKTLLEKRGWSAVVIDGATRDKLLSEYKSQIPDGWEVIAHHMTINPFAPTDDAGKDVKLKVIATGKSDKAFAVKVTGYDGKTNNKFPHITIAIDRSGGAKPKDSNDISEWKDVQDGIVVSGVVENL
jgi:hypothetical protein